MKNFEFYIVIFSFSFLLFYLSSSTASADNLITNVKISVCGDGAIMPGELCDDGAGNNTGAYASSTAERHCGPDCFSYGPYCGDSILEVRFDEECDDGNNTSGDFCSSDCKEEEATPPPGGGGLPPAGNIPSSVGYQGQVPSSVKTQVTIKGKSYPNSDVNILLDGKVIGSVKADTNADFLFTSSDVDPGTATFGFWSEDKNGLRSISFTTTFEVIQSAVTTISNVFIPPTIDTSAKQLKAGDLLTISGQSVPDVKVITHVNSDNETVMESESNDNGDWALQMDTASLAAENFHTAKAYFELQKLDQGVIQSGFSRSVSFYIGEKKLGEVVSADINGDGKVNLMDFSIFLLSWGTDDVRSDFNQDGTVNLADFSILLFYWTG